MERISKWVSADTESSAILTGMIAALLLVGVSIHSLEAEAAVRITDTCDTPVTLAAEHIDNENTREESGPEEMSDEILWFARAVYSETKRPEEQELVAWVIRNRVDTAYRGNTTYRDTVLDPHQFSGLNSRDGNYEYNVSRSPSYSARAWQHALLVAKEVYSAPESARPFSKTVRHFYSPIAVTSHPKWAVDKSPVVTITDPATQAERFVFIAGV